MARFNTFSLADVYGAGESIKGQRTRNALLDQQQVAVQRENALFADPNATPEQFARGGRSDVANALISAGRFTDEQKIFNTKLLNAAAAEVAQNPAAISRWLPEIQRAGIQFDGDPTQLPPEQLQQVAKKLFDSTSAMLQAYSRSSGSGGVQSTFQGENGNAWVMTRDGRAIDTGVAMQKFSPKTVEVGGGLSVFDPNVRGVTGEIATPGQQIGAAASLAGAQQGAKEAATTAAIPGQVNAKTQTERFALHIDEGLRAADSLPVINRALELLDSVKTGGIDAAKLAATNFFGVTGADEAELSNNLGKAILSQLRATFGAQFTEREGARLDALEANFGKSTEGNKRILHQVKALVERAARRGIDAAKRTGDTFSAEEIERSMKMQLTPPSQKTEARGGWTVEAVQ